MKKFLYCIFIFISVFLFSFVSEVNAKSVTKNGITISFDEDDELNMAYRNFNSFKILSDKSFYFNGVRHTFNNDYSIVDNDISVKDNKFDLMGDTFTIDLDEKIVISSKIYQTYGFKVIVDLSENKEYTFTQELCYKYGDISGCNIDKDDETIVTEDVISVFYYDFLPFYDEDIRFDYLTYKFKMISDDETIVFDDITFNANEISYKDFFTIRTYDYSEDYIYNSRYNDKNYVLPSLIEGETLYIDAIYYPGAAVEAVRKYKITFSVCVGEDYNNCKEVKTYDEQPNSSIYRVYSIPLSNIVYNKNNVSTNYDSFKLKGTYVCNENIKDNCTSLRSQNEITNVESEVYYLNLKNPTLESTLKGASISGCEVNVCYGVNSSVTNEFEFSDDNNIISINYLVSKTKIQDSSLIVDSFTNGSEITLDEEGLYYIYFKLHDDSGMITYRIYGYLLDFKAPSLNSDNFSDYSEDNSYNSISIRGIFSDDRFSYNSVKVYYLISDYDRVVTKEDVMNESDLYINEIVLEDIVDGSYKVCFVAKDPLENYSELICSGKLNLDKTPLVKDEVSVNSNNVGYQQSVNITINIDDVNEGESFKCGVFLNGVVISSEKELIETCYNNTQITFKPEGENEYKLWIYASDKASNFSLLELDKVYYVDNKAPVVSYSVNGDIGKYSNDVKLDINVSDLNNIDTSSLSYMFYLNSYNENSFTSFDLNEGISYPYDYYGVYKLAIKACDVINNCKINTYKDTFYIDTGEIKIELIGKETVTILKWGKYKENGASASKGNQGKYKVSLDYTVEGSVDTSEVGVYYLTYSSGEGMNKVSVVRKVIVKDSIPYIVTFSSLLVVGEIIILLRLFIKKRKNDSI